MNSNIPAGAATLLDFIGKAETGKTGAEAYGIIVFNNQKRLPKPLTEYTIDELLLAQKSWAKNWKGSAAGKYQIIRKTLLGLVAKLALPGGTKFSSGTQDRLGFELLKQRGWGAFTSGQISVGAFALGLAKEWASMPVLSTVQGANRQVTRGMSYYAGDGVNKSQKDAGALEAILAQIGGKSVEPVAPPETVVVTTPVGPPEVVPPPAQGNGKLLSVIIAIIIALGAGILKLFGGN